MASYLDYAGHNGERPDRWPNLREAATKPWMGQTAVIGRRPWLVVGFDGEMYELENEFGEYMRTNKFEVLEHESDNNRTVAASRVEGSALGAGMRLAACDCQVGALDFDRDEYEWSVLTDEGDVIDIEARVAELENADWKVADTLKEALEMRDRANADLDLEAEPGSHICPHCGSNEIDFGDDVAYCNDCGWHGGWDEVQSADHPVNEELRRDHFDDDWQHDSSMDKGSPYPENSEKNAPDHSPPSHKWPKKVNDIYNACMREGSGRGDTKEEKESSCAAIANAQYNKMKKKRDSGKEAEADAIEEAAGNALTAGDVARANELKELAEKKRLAKITQEDGKFKYADFEAETLEGALAARDVLGDYAGEGLADRGDHKPDPLVCPNCGSHTVGLLNSENKEFGCKACGKRFKHDVIINPKAPKDKKGAIEIQDSDGNIIISGQYYSLRGDNYKIPDVIKVLEIQDGVVVATVDDNPTPIKISSDDIKSQGYSFEKLPIYSNIEQHDWREATYHESISMGDVGENLKTNLGWDNWPNKPRDNQDLVEMNDRSQEFTLPTPSGGTLWVRADNQGRVTGWSVPSFDGGPGQYSDRDLDRVQSMVDQATIQNRMSMDKTARRSFTPGEQKNLIEEKGDARNKDKLRLDDSHYTESHVEDDIDFLF